MRRKKFIYPVSSLAGSSLGNIFSLLKVHQVGRKYYFRAALTVLVAFIFTPLNWIEKVLWRRRINSFHIKQPPVFIVGFMRSGTTLLHNLLCQDPKAGYTTTLHTVFPHCVLTQKSWLGPFINMLVPDKRPFDNVSMDMRFPQEEEFALSNLQLHSVYNFFVFPSAFDWFIDHDYQPGSLPTDGLARWKKEYRQLVVKSLLNTKGERYISKNPQNIPRIELLNELFPGAGFVFIYRDPYVVVESLFNFILAIFNSIKLQEVPENFSRKNVARFYSIALNIYLENKNKKNTPFIYEVKMEDFVRDQIGGLRKIYQSFGMAGFEEAVPAFEAYLSNNPPTRNEKYPIHEDTIYYINLYASGIVTELGYPLRNLPAKYT